MPVGIGRAPEGRLLIAREATNPFTPARGPKRSPSRQHLARSTSAPSEESAQTKQDQPLQQLEAKTINLEPIKQLKAEFGVASIPHPDKAAYGGEDAFFTSSVGGGAFGVADGVGGWQESGINPAEYSRTFMRLACAFLEGKEAGKTSVGELPESTSVNASLSETAPNADAETEEALSRLTPQAALQAAHDGTRLPGSTTACVMRLDRSKNMLSAANVGDSGFLIVRDGSVEFRSPPLQHFFDCPLQFAAYPDYTNATDSAEDAGLYQLPVQHGDLIVAGTDGLWDNVHQEEIVQILSSHQNDIQKAADALARAASEHANDKKFSSPYTQEARKQGIDLPWILKIANASFSDGKFKLGHMKGGKLDDITVVTAVVKEEQVQPKEQEESALQAQALSEIQPQASSETNRTPEL